MNLRWDIFCNVIDNYGDIGVAWRLARSLAVERGHEVRLWVDDLGAFQRIGPAVDPAQTCQICDGVAVWAWRSPWADVAPADVVIEAFGCALPESYVAAMGARARPPVWVNLEYLSAEPWVEEHHLLPSPHPRLPLTKYFFFPGYTARTGGLLCEADLEAQRVAFLETGTVAYWERLGLPAKQAQELRVSLFAYENPQLPALLDAWAGGGHPVTCLVPEGRVVPQLAAWLGKTTLPVGSVHERNALQLRVLPFTDQPGYDRLLWACDLNFVRGEDSCVRAQLAGRPMVWQAYPQSDRIHWDKLDALLRRYVQGLEPQVADAVTGLWHDWNGMSEAPRIAKHWARWRQHWNALEVHAGRWSTRVAEAGSLAEKLAEFAENKLK